MSKETISPHQQVTVHLTTYGAFVLDRHVIDPDLKWEEWCQAREESRKEHGPRRKRPVTMQLWEAFKIFGPNIESSVRLPIDSIDVEVDSKLLDDAIEEAEQAGERAAEALERARDFEASLRKLMGSIGIGDAFKAPEQLAAIVRHYKGHAPPRVPTCAGPWWHGGVVVEVVKIYDSEGFELFVMTRNNRRKPLGDYDAAGWHGPAIKDRRVEVATEDIPF